jgi:hypothetical protein
MLNNEIDAFFCVAGFPTPAIVNLAANMDILILNIRDEHLEKIINEHPFYTEFTIPAGDYLFQNEAIQTVAVKAAIIAGSKLSEDLVYNLTRILFENKDQIESAHVRGSELSPVYAVEGISVPFHPGALRYYRETKN